MEAWTCLLEAQSDFFGFGFHATQLHTEEIHVIVLGSRIATEQGLHISCCNAKQICEDPLHMILLSTHLSEKVQIW